LRKLPDAKVSCDKARRIDRGNGNSAAENVSALNPSTTGYYNTAHGWFSLFSNTTGSGNTASGIDALFSNTTGNMNTALGILAGVGVATASNVICIGAKVAGADVSNTTWVGNVYNTTTVSGTTAPVIVSDGGQLGTAASSERFKKDIATMDDVMQQRDRSFDGADPLHPRSKAKR
jgi:hypothetical protein